MSIFGSTQQTNTSLFGQSTPVNQNRTGSGFLFNLTGGQPSTLTSTPLGTSLLVGAATPSTSTLQTSSPGTIHKFDPVVGVDKITKNSIQTQIRTKIFNVCAMPVYEKKSMEELRLEDYIDNRKFGSTTSSLFSSTTFGGTSTITNPTTTPALGSSLFGNKPATTTAPTLSFAFGPSATTTTAAASPFSFGAPTTTTANPAAPFGTQVPATAPITSNSPFTFGSAQPAATTTTATSGFGFGATSLFSSANTAAATTAGASFGFSVGKPNTTGTFSFAPTAATTATTAPTFSLFPTAAATTTAPALFTATNQPNVINPQSSVDTRTQLQLFQTMLNIQPFNNQLGYLARNIKPNIGLDRARLRTAPDSTSVQPLNSVFSPLLTKPSVLTSSTTTPPSALVHPLPTHPHTLPSVLLPSTATGTSIGLFGKRKLADSFLDDDDDNSLMMDDGPSSVNKISKVNAIKRPRVLDMNKIRSVVLGGGGGSSGGILETSTREEQFSDTFVVKSTSDTFVVKSTSDNLSGWKKFATYDAYLASKKPQVEHVKTIDEEEKPTNFNENQFERERAFRPPRLTHDDYYTKPTIDELQDYFNDQGQCLVKEFTVGREHFGSVTFQGSKINLAGLDLDELIKIDHRQVTVYPDDSKKPIEGEELNCQAIISLIGVYPIDRSISNSGKEVTDPQQLIDMNYINYLREMTKKFHGKFIDYDVYTGTWTFKVEHF